MKNSQQNAARWLAQSEYDLKESEKSLTDGSFAYAAFFAEQSAQKALKAFLISRGRRYITIHSVGELLKEAVDLESSFSKFLESGKELDRHYLASRYPDALPEPAIPAESYTKEEAERTVAIAKSIFEISRELI